MKVSVAMCTYNGEKFIEKQLRSICEQTRLVDEIIISDDGSKDSTLVLCESILQEYGIPYVIKRNKVALRVMKNFAQCFSLCTGDIIFSCDQDDIWEKNKVEIIMKQFGEKNHIDMIATNATLIDANDEVMNINLKDSIGFDHTKMMDSLLRTFCITGATMAFRKEFQSTYFYTSQFWLHDGWLSLVATLRDSFLYLDTELTKYRLHGNNECGVGDVDTLHHGTMLQLKKKRQSRMIKTVLKAPYYFQDYAKERCEMYQELWQQRDKHNWEWNTVNTGMLEECIAFWKGRVEIKNMTYGQLREMRKAFKDNGKYERFSESSKFYYFDLYFWLVYKIIPRRK